MHCALVLPTSYPIYEGMASASGSEDSEEEYEFDLRHGLLHAIGITNIDETLYFIYQKLEELTAGHGNDSKILILTGSHGGLDGSDALQDPALLDPESFVELCEALGTSHHKEDFDSNRTNFQRIKRWTKQEDFVAEYDFRQIRLIKSLRKKLSRKKVHVQVLDVANFIGANGSSDLVRTIQDGDPSAVIVNWCYNKNGFTSKLLTAAGLFPKLVLRNERRGLTGNESIQLDEDQSCFLDRAAELIKKHYPNISEKGHARPGLYNFIPSLFHALYHLLSIIFLHIYRYCITWRIWRRPGLRFVLEGDPGTGKTLLALEVVRMLRAARGLSDADVLVWIGDGRQHELRNMIKETGDLKKVKYWYPESYVFTESAWEPGKNHFDEMFGNFSERLRYSAGEEYKIFLIDEYQELHPDDYKRRRNLIEESSTTMDIVLCIKPTYWGIPKEPESPNPYNMLSMRLRTPHRQGYQPMKFWQFLVMHDKRHTETWFPGQAPNWYADRKSLVTSDLPPSDTTLWIVLPEAEYRRTINRVNVKVILDLIKEFVNDADDRKIIVCTNNPTDGGENISCPRHPYFNWKIMDRNSIHGIETEVN